MEALAFGGLDYLVGFKPWLYQLNPLLANQTVPTPIIITQPNPNHTETSGPQA